MGSCNRCIGLFILIIALIYTSPLLSQNKPDSEVAYIQYLINNDSLAKADGVLQKNINDLKKKEDFTRLISYLPLLGNLKLADGNSQKAIDRASALVDFLITLQDPVIASEALIHLSNLYYDSRQSDKVYEVSLQALKYARMETPVDQEKLSKIEYNLGTASLNLGKLEDGRKHLYNSKNILEQQNISDLNQFYNTYNSIGRLHSSLSKIDSSTYFYQKALKSLNSMDSTEINRDYWKAIVNNNISLNFQNTGNTDKAIEYITNAIIDFKKFMEVAEDESKKLRARRYRLSTIDNLGTFYDGIGEYNRAVDLMTYSYNEKQDFLDENDPNIVFSLVILGHTNLNAKNYNEAADYIDKALEIINKNPANYTFLHSFTLTLRASIYEAMDNYEGAKQLYEQSEAMYNESFEGTYTRDHLDALVEMSRFYSENGDAEKAIAIAKTTYDYTDRDEFENDLTRFHHIQNLANVYLKLKDYSNALKYSEEAINYFNKSIRAETMADSIQNEFHKPRALLVNAKAKYYLNPSPEREQLDSLLSQVEKGISILEKRKINTKSTDDLNLLIIENEELFNFAKQLRLDLYKKSGDKSYLDDLMTIHESSIYNKIRSRLNLRDKIAFYGIPDKVTTRERDLKNRLSQSLNSPDNTIETFFEADSNWQVFLDSINEQYPKYYKMRYASMEEPLDDLQQHISDETTVIRYFFIENQLYAYIVSKTEKQLYELAYKSDDDLIARLNNVQMDLSEVSEKLVTLYNELWKPFEDNISTNQIIILPDRELFNLSFETLTPEKIDSYRDLASKSLLSKYSIAYNYSLLLINPSSEKNDFKNYVGFAPEFNDEMKSRYSRSIEDSITLDRTYLNLLPQPFSVELVNEYSDQFRGEAYLNMEASKENFIEHAGKHKIIHISSHAESNNINPDLSQIIFAKDSDFKDNSLYAYEIYNSDMSSELSVITACETGKPSYQSGEGMISLAHAFNFAGSKSMVTGLWKIDEKSTTEILEYFYDNLKTGMAKNEALRQAKLKYISTANEQTISPQYWAGLILIGDVAPIDLPTTSKYWIWVIIMIISLVLGVLLYKKFNSN